MKISSFRDLYLAELQELRSVTVQFGEALEVMSDATSNSDLKQAFLQQREDIERETERLDQILDRHRVAADSHNDQAMEALIEEMTKMVTLVEGDQLRDAALIGSMQRLEHYQIAAYGTAATLAGQLDLTDDEKTLHAAAQKKKQADTRLSKLAKSKVNRFAMAA